MKLVEILARELDKWPFEGYEGYAEQDHDLEVRFMKCGTSQKDFFASNLAEEDEKHSCSDGIPYAGPVTRADWEAERARIKGEKTMPKANKDGWIRHRGGKCPVETGTMVDYRMRDGEIMTQHAGNLEWDHCNECGDIMAWRPHKPVEQRIIEAEQSALAAKANEEAEMPAAKYFEGPIQWRDRIREIDAASIALNEERTSLVAKLKAEGLALISEPIKAVDSDQVDMGDWRNWRVGDLVEVLNPESSGLGKGAIVKIIEVDFDVDEDEDEATFMPCKLKGANTWLYFRNMKWHSRPTN